MAPPPPALTALPYLQEWRANAGELVVHVLLAPSTDPRRPMSDGWAGNPVPAAPAFQGSEIVLKPLWTDEVNVVPNRADASAAGEAATLAMPDEQVAIFKHFAELYDLGAAPVAVEQSASGTLMKYLPVSYRSRFAFVQSRTPLAFTDDRYHCALKCPPDAFPPVPTPSRQLSWGEAFAAMVRQPAIARAAGLVHTLTLDVGTSFDAGGWLFFDLVSGSAFETQRGADEDFVRIFATRVPALGAGEARPVFSPVQFPVGRDAAATAAFGPLDDVFGDAVKFDDGFAKIVHARQPLTHNLVAEEDEGDDLPPLADAGIQLGWDDEDVVEAMNRAVGLYPDGSAPPRAPSGVTGYRVDVRPAGNAAWSSLCRVTARDFRFGAAEIDGYEAELNVEIHPNRIGEQLFVPAYYTRWTDRSLVAETADERLLLNRQDDTPDIYLPDIPEGVPLRYGRRYDFRVRLADPTGGGPDLSEAPVRPAEAPVASWHFRRALPMASVTTTAAAAGSPPTAFLVERPGIAYPQAAFASAPDALARLAAIARANMADPAMARPAVVPDPDATHLEITVLFRPPAFDPAADDTGWQRLYSTYRTFPPMAADGDAPALQLELDWRDGAELAAMGWEVPTQPADTVSGPVAVPRARDVRIDVRAVGRADLTHWMSDRARYGERTSLSRQPFYVPALVEPPALASNDPLQVIASVFLQPDPPERAPTRTAVMQRRAGPTLASRLADAVGLVRQDGTLFGAPGERTLFACHGLKHHLAPDRGSLVITSAAELPLQWINVVKFTIDRDWSWRGAARPFIEIERTIRSLPDGTSETQVLGGIDLPHAVNTQATRGGIDRRKTVVVVIDAFEPILRNGLPQVTELGYALTTLYENGATERLDVANRLPVTTPPKALPRISSVGHALSPYEIGEDYATTGARERRLWVEFAEPPEDPRDTLFARALASAPDPMLMPSTEPVADPPDYEKSALDPETVRVVRPAQPDDLAGLSAYQELVPAANDPSRRFYLLPRPENLSADANELLGFFTYEFRMGHGRGTPAAPFWSTAQGRYGPALTLEGVQHPAPALDCRVLRDGLSIKAWAEYARPSHRGRDVSPRQPNSEIWFVLYARVVQADRSTHRPIQLATVRAEPLKSRGKAAPPTGQGSWAMGDVKRALERWHLPDDAPLSALAVELLPEPNGRFADPLGGDLSKVRILRTSPLVEVSSGCCQ